MSAPDPSLGKAWVFPAPESWDLAVGNLNPRQWGLGLDSKVRATLAGGPGSCSGGSANMYRGPALSHGGPDPTVGILECIAFPGHMVSLEPSMWWSWVLFPTRLERVVWVPRPHAVARGTPDPGYR
jgi:hypothetical protein